MKKKITFIFVLVMVFVMLFTFIGCDKKENNEENNNQTEGETPQEPVSTAISDSQLITDALDEIIGENDVHLSVQDLSLLVNLGGEMNFEGPIDLYLRRTETGYDMSVEMQILKKEKREDSELEKEYYVVNVSYMRFVYVGGYTYLFTRTVDQVIVDGVGYESYSASKTDPDTKDNYLLESTVIDWEKAAALTDSKGESRLTETREVKKANTLQGVVDYMVFKADFLKDWGWTTEDKIIEVAKNLLSEAAVLAKGENEADENGNRVLELNIDALAKYNEIVGIVNENLEKPLGELVNALTKKDKAFVTDVINRLFPAEGKCLTINNFVKELEKILGENEIIFSLKSVVNRIQEASGLTAQQIADALNPLLESVLPEGTSVTINPKEGETLYDTLERSAFDMLGVDTILSIISPAEPGETEGETIPALTSASLNAKLTAALYGETDSVTLAELSETFDFVDVVIGIASYSANTLKANLKFNFDKDNKFTSLEVDADFDLTMILPDDVVLPEGEEVPGAKIKVGGKVLATYENNDDKFAVTDWKVEKLTYALTEEVTGETKFYYVDIIKAAGIEVEEGAVIDSKDIGLRIIDNRGFISTLDTYRASDTNGSYLGVYKKPADYREIDMYVYYNGICYIIEMTPSMSSLLNG